MPTEKQSVKTSPFMDSLCISKGVKVLVKVHSMVAVLHRLVLLRRTVDKYMYYRVSNLRHWWLECSYRLEIWQTNFTEV